MGVPQRILRNISWAYFRGPWASKQELNDAILAEQQEAGGGAGWDPDARLVTASSVDVVWEDFSSSDPPVTVTIVGSDSGHVTALDLMWGIEQAFGPRIAGLDRCFFEGLTLRADTAGDPIPCYDLMLGS